MQWWLLPDILNFLARLAWPAVVLLIFIGYKKPIIKLLGNITKLKYGDAEIEFSHALEMIEKTIDKSHQFNDNSSKSVHEGQINSNIETLIPADSAEQEDSSMRLMRHWIRFEATVRDIFVKQNYSLKAVNVGLSPSLNLVTAKNAPFSLLLRDMSLKEMISTEEVEIIRLLQKLRNQTVHGGVMNIGVDQLNQYIKILEDVRLVLENKYAKQNNSDAQK